MKKLVVKQIGVRSAFKVTLYVVSVPMALVFILGLIFTVIGASFPATRLLYVGIPYLIMPFFLLFLYGLFSMLISFVYNKFAGKFGGLELQVEEERTEHPEL